MIKPPTYLMEGRQWISLDFSKVFDTVPFSILLKKLSNSGMSRFTMHWGKTSGRSGLKGLYCMGLHVAGLMKSVPAPCERGVGIR